MIQFKLIFVAPSALSIMSIERHSCVRDADTKPVNQALDFVVSPSNSKFNCDDGSFKSHAAYAKHGGDRRAADNDSLAADGEKTPFNFGQVPVPNPRYVQSHGGNGRLDLIQELVKLREEKLKKHIASNPGMYQNNWSRSVFRRLLSTEAITSEFVERTYRPVVYDKLSVYIRFLEPLVRIRAQEYLDKVEVMYFASSSTPETTTQPLVTGTQVQVKHKVYHGKWFTDDEEGMSSEKTSFLSSLPRLEVKPERTRLRRGDIVPSSPVWSHTSGPRTPPTNPVPQSPVLKRQSREARYKKKMEKEKPSKAQRLTTRRLMRDLKQRMSHAMTFNEAQAGFFDFNITHGINSEVSDLLNEIVTKFQNACEGMSNTTHNVAHTLRDTVQDVMRGIPATMDNVHDNVMCALAGFAKKLWIIPLLGCLYYCLTNVAKFMTKVVGELVYAMLSSIVPTGLWDRLKDFWPKGETKSQGGFDILSLGTLITIAMSFITLGDKEPKYFLRDFHKSIGHLPRQIEGWTALANFLGDHIENFVNYIRKIFGKDAVVVLKSGYKRIDNWCTMVTEVVHSSKTTDNMSPDWVNYVMALRSEGKDLLNAYRNDKVVTINLHKYMGYLDGVVNLCAAALNSMKGTRPPPVSMVLFGEPGIGKTLLTKRIASLVMAKHLKFRESNPPVYNYDSEIYQLGSGSFWNGYAGQFTVIADDFGQNVAVPGEDNDYMTWIRMVNCWAYPLNFADLENKGKNFFRSSFILATTNARGFDNAQTVINETKALTRRVDLGFEVFVEKEFSINGFLDMDKVLEYEEENDAFPYHAWRFYKHVFDVGEASYTDLSVSYTILQVIEMAQQKITDNKGMHSFGVCSLERDLKQYMEDHCIEAQSGINDPLDFKFDLNTPSCSKYGESFKKQVLKDPDFPDHLLHASTQAVVGGLTLLEDYGKEKIEEAQEKEYQREQDLKRAKEEMFDWFEDSMTYVEQLMKNPLIAFLAAFATAKIVIQLVKMTISTVIKWFKGDSSKKLKKSLQTVSHISPDLIADLLDNVRKEDFQEVVEDGSGYKVVEKFSSQTIHKILSRMTGNTVSQSNEPDMCRVPYKVIKSNHVYESDIIVSQADTQGNSISNATAKNLMHVAIYGDKGKLVLGQILFIRGTLAIMPNHFLDVLHTQIQQGFVSEHDIIKIVHPSQKGFFVEYKVKDFLTLPQHSMKDDDCTFIKFDAMRAARNIAHHFISESDLASLSKVRVRLDTIEGDDPFIHRSRSLEAKRIDNIVVNNGGKSYVVAKSFSYKGYTRTGDCGGVVCLEDAKAFQCKRIIGIHVAGAPSLGIGYSNIITQEKVRQMLDKFSVPDEIVPQCNGSLTEVDPPIEGSFTGLFSGVGEHNLNPLTSLTRTPLYGKWGNQEKVPAPLCKFVDEQGIVINPMKEALKSYASPILHYDQDLVLQASHQAFEKVCSETTQHERKIFSFEDAVQGIPGEFNGIPRNTSPGYPYILEGMTNKKPFFGNEDVYTFHSDECVKLKEKVSGIIESAKNNVREFHVYTDFLKDELRSKEKAALGKTRAISAAPLAYVIAFRQYFLSFTTAVQQTRIENGIAVGINPYTEWDVLAKKLYTKGPHCIAGDYTSFDGSEQPQIHDAILEQINLWYNDGDENARVRSILWLEVTHSRHFGGVHGKCDMLYQWNKCLPSGHPATSIINSLYNLTIFNMCWLVLAPAIHKYNFWDKVYLCTYGDDNVSNIAPDVIGVFNQNTITRAMSTFGMVYTGETKGVEVQDSRSLSEISFLKRSFRFDKYLNKYTGPQELASILYIPYWCKNRKMILDITSANLELTLAELSLHDPEVWNVYAPRLATAYAEVMEGRTKMPLKRECYLEYTQVLVPPWLKG